MEKAQRLMKDQVSLSRKYLRICLLILLPSVCSCENKINMLPKSDLQILPSLTVKDFETIYSDSGKLQLIMRGPLMQQFNNNEAPYYDFPNGMKVTFYEGHKDPVGTVTAKYAKYTKSTSLWELKDSVVVVNEKNEKLETEVLYWDEPKNLIYSDRFVRITDADEIVLGTGFESDPKLSKRKIKKVSATIYLPKDEQ
jgi:LPS export ABC transporter protein LptC